MKIFGHPWIESDSFYGVDSIEDIKRTPSNSILYIDSLSKQIDMVKYFQNNSLSYALKVEDIKEAIFANNFGATFILCSKELARELMPIAQNYLFDTQIIAYISSESEIAKMAKSGVDGVMFIR